MNVKSILSSTILASLTLTTSASFAAAPTQAQVLNIMPILRMPFMPIHV